MRARVIGRAGSVSTPRSVVEAEELDVYEFRLGMWLSTHTADFCVNISQREMARRLRMGNGVTERALLGLEKLGVVAVERPGNTRSISVTFNVEVWERVGQLTPSGSVLTPSGSTTDPERVTKDLQGESQESLSSKTPSSPPRKQRERDPIWDELVKVCGDVRTELETSRRGKCVKQLKEVGADSREVLARAAEMRRRWPKITLTDTGLVGRWSSVMPPAPEDAQAELIKSYNSIRYT